ncbi:cation transporter [Ligilactobacillus salitolerans]|uniref:Cation transporter n=1 Tax=Ligilactobacillus salitolerans TaxID=1808352 RepID=A0A401IQI6_9LACO|nr:cation transporter [Ligilactobacillus salitolerans]
MSSVLKKISRDKMFLVAFTVTVLSMVFSRPQVSDIDWQTISSLAAMLALVATYERLEVLSYGAAWLTRKAKNKRWLVQVLVAVAFFSAMFLTNDAAIIAVTPILILVARKIDLPVILPVVLVNMAANLGSMATPFGNPQNLFLLNHFHLSLLDFLQMSLPIVLASLVLLGLFSLKIPSTPVTEIKLPSLSLKWSKLGVTLVGTVLVVAGIFSLVPKFVMLAAAVSVVWLVDPQIFKRIDYGLLLTFIMFFIAVGDLSRFQAIHDFMQLIGHSQTVTYLSGLATSQVISNVPAAILLAPYTHHAYALFLGVNIGGLGTLIASLANLLAYREYYARASEPSPRYFKVFLQVNLLGLLVLGVLGWFLLGLKG